MSMPPAAIIKKIMKYNLRAPVQETNAPVISENVQQYGPSAAKLKKKKEGDLEDCNDHDYYKPTPRMLQNENSHKFSMLYKALTSNTKEDKQCNRNITEQIYSEISVPLSDDEILSDVDLDETSTSSGGVSSHNQVAEAHTPHKRRLHNKQYCAIGTQVKMKSNNEKMLLKRKKVLEQKLKRQNQYIDHMKSLLAVVKKYTSQSDIENIIKGNFSNLCKLFKKSNLPSHPQGIRYSDEVKAFAFMLHSHSPKAYELLRSYMPLPHVKTLRNSVS